MVIVSLEEIKRLVGLQLGIKNVQGDDLFVENLGAESADLVNIVALVEEKYQIVIKESEMAHIRTSSDLLSVVQSHLQKGD